LKRKDRLMEILDRLIEDAWNEFDDGHETFKVAAKERNTEAMFRLMKETGVVSEILRVLLNLKIELNKKGQDNDNQKT